MIRKVCFFGLKKKRFMQTESVLQTKNRSGPAKNRFSVALKITTKSLEHEMWVDGTVTYRVLKESVKPQQYTRFDTHSGRNVVIMLMATVGGFT